MEYLLAKLIRYFSVTNTPTLSRWYPYIYFDLPLSWQMGDVIDGLANDFNNLCMQMPTAYPSITLCEETDERVRKQIAKQQVPKIDTVLSDEERWKLFDIEKLNLTPQKRRVFVRKVDDYLNKVYLGRTKPIRVGCMHRGCAANSHLVTAEDRLSGQVIKYGNAAWFVVPCPVTGYEISRRVFLDYQETGH